MFLIIEIIIKVEKLSKNVKKVSTEVLIARYSRAKVLLYTVSYMQTDNWLNYKPYSFDYDHKLNIYPFKPSHTGGLTLNNMKCWRNSKLKMFIILKHYRVILQNILMQKRVLWIFLEPLYSGTPVFWNPFIFWNTCILEPLYFGTPLYSGTLVFWNSHYYGSSFTL